MKKRYEVRVIADAEQTQVSTLLLATDSGEEAKAFADGSASAHEYGVAIWDRRKREVDYGDRTESNLDPRTLETYLAEQGKPLNA